MTHPDLAAHLRAWIERERQRTPTTVAEALIYSLEAQGRIAAYKDIKREIRAFLQANGGSRRGRSNGPAL